MSELELPPSQRPALTSVIFILLTVAIGFYIVGPAIGILLAMGFVDVPLDEMAAAMGDPVGHPWIKTPMMIMQGAATFVGLVAGPWLYWAVYERKSVASFGGRPGTPPVAFLLVPILIISFSVMNSFFVTWNSHVAFPEFLRGFEHWARDFEDRATLLTGFVTTFDSIGEFIAGLIVIAILPAIGEELVFRGMLQPKLHQATRNPHAAIWISAFVFSAMHLQFFGFVPRLLLGALFGYLYLWSGNLLVPIFAHFVNNGLGVVMIYLQHLGLVELDVQSTEALPWTAVVSGTILTFGLLFYFKNLFDKKLSAS